MDEEKKYYELDIDGFEDIPEYTGPELMTDEYCSTPQFLGDYESSVAWKHAMAARCIEDDREVVFIRNLPYVDNVDKNGNVTEHVPWESPLGDTLRFLAEARNPKTGEWEEKIFTITTAERSAMIDGALVLEGTKANGTKYTISAHDFAKELDIERDRRGLEPISIADPIDVPTQVEQPEKAKPYTDEEIEEMLGLGDDGVEQEDIDELLGLDGAEDSKTVGIFSSNDGSGMERVYIDPEYGDIWR